MPIKGTRSAWSRVTHMHTDVSSHLHYYSGQSIFWSYLSWMRNKEDQMCAATGTLAIVQGRELVSLQEKKKASLHGGLKRQQFSCFCPCSAIALRHFRQQSVCNRGESILWSKGSSIFGWVHILPQFLSHCHQITRGPFLQCQCVSPVSTRVGQKGKILDYAVFLSLNLKFWFM